MAGLLQYLDAMAKPLRGESAVGAAHITLPKVGITGEDLIGDEPNTMLAYAIIWALQDAGVTISGIARPEDRSALNQVVTNIDSRRMTNELGAKQSLTLHFVKPLTTEQHKKALENIEKFKSYARHDWVAIDAEQARKNCLRGEIEAHELWANAYKTQGRKTEVPTLENIPIQPHQMIKPYNIDGANPRMHNVLFHYMYEVAKENYTDKQNPDRPDAKLFTFQGSNNGFSLINADNLQAAQDRAARMIGVPPRLLTQKRPESKIRVE